jgi:hypothetical protein
MAEPLSLQQHLSFVPEIAAAEADENATALAAYSDRLEECGNPSLAKQGRVVRDYNRTLAYLDESHSLVAQVDDLLTDLLDGCCLYDRKTCLDCQHCPHHSSLDHEHLEGILALRWTYPIQRTADPSQLAASRQRVETLLSPFCRRIKALAPEGRFEVVSYNIDSRRVKLDCELWLLPALIAYLKLRQQGGQLDEALGTNQPQDQSQPGRDNS